MRRLPLTVPSDHHGETASVKLTHCRHMLKVGRVKGPQRCAPFESKCAGRSAQVRADLPAVSRSSRQETARAAHCHSVRGCWPTGRSHIADRP